MPEASPTILPNLTLAVGDRVVYPNQGICRVTSVEAREVAGQTLTFVTMRREEDGAVVMVPQGKVRSIGLRKVSSAKEVDEVFEFLKSESDKATLDWKQRARTNLDRMSTGGLLGLAEVVKGLQVLSELRPLPTKERELYDNARHLLTAEISASIGVSPCDAEDAIDIVLFPPGRERPKRTVEEFRPVRGEDEELGELGEDLIGLGGDLELPGEEPPPEEVPEAEEAPEEEAPAPARGAKKKAARAEAPPPPDAPKRKRGRPPKAKPAGPPPPPKKRGRPPKTKVAAPPSPPKKRGRPPKAAAAKPKKKK